MRKLNFRTWFVVWIVALFLGVPVSASAIDLYKLDIQYDFFVDEETADKVYCTIFIAATDKDGNEVKQGDISRVEVFRKYKEPAFTFENPVPGEIMGQIDDKVEQGKSYTYNFDIYASNGNKRHIETNYALFVGEDTPEKIQEVTYNVNGNKVELSWLAPTKGAHFGLLKKDQLRYDISRQVKEEVTEVAKNLKDVNYVDELKVDELTSVKYILTPKTDAGSGESLTTQRILIGEKHKVPFSETFANGLPDHDTWIIADASNYWEYTDKYVYNPVTNKKDVESYDGDGGMLTATAYVYSDPKTYRIKSSPIDLSNCDAPVLEFYYYAMANRENCKLNVNIYREAEETPTLATTLDYGTALEGWTPVHVDLAAYKDAKDIAIEFEGIATKDVLFAIDCIRIDNIAGDNLAVTGFKSPAERCVGEDAELSVVVVNNGLNAAGAYCLRFMRDGNVIKELPDEGLEPGKSRQFAYSDPVTNDFGDVVRYSAEVIYSSDADVSDNAAEPVAMEVAHPTLAVVSDLAGTADKAAGTVKLTWSEPAYAVEDVIVDEGFEEYPNYTISDFGPWTALDLDQQRTYGLYNKGIKSTLEKDGYKPDYDPKAFQVFDTDVVADPNATTPWKARSGKQVLVSLPPYYGAKNDWLISPRLSGDAQQIEFYVLAYNDSWGKEELFVYGSKYGKDEGDFDMANPLLYDAADKTGFKVTNLISNRQDYQKVTVDLPKGTRHFAIRVSTPSSNGFLLIDDIHYSAARAGVKVALKGYNVYADNVKVNDEPVAECEYVLRDAANVKQCHVCAVYDLGESEPSNVLNLGSAGIAGVDADAAEGRLRVYDLCGRLVIDHGTKADLQKLSRGVYVVNGQKIMIK